MAEWCFDCGDYACDDCDCPSRSEHERVKDMRAAVLTLLDRCADDLEADREARPEGEAWRDAQQRAENIVNGWINDGRGQWTVPLVHAITTALAEADAQGAARVARRMETLADWIKGARLTPDAAAEHIRVALAEDQRPGSEEATNAHPAMAGNCAHGVPMAAHCRDCEEAQ
jgi:hypothetical protein